jgi:hypothetical protein
VVGLTLLAGFACGILTALPLRTAAPSMDPPVRVALCSTSVLLGSFLALHAWRLQNRASLAAPAEGAAEEASSGSALQLEIIASRWTMRRHLIDALVMSTCGAYAA